MAANDGAPDRAGSVAFNLGQYQAENTLSDLLEKHAKEFKIMHEKFQGREDDDYILYRFLKAFKFDVDVSSKQLEATLKWRHEVDYESIKAAVKNVDPNDPEAFPGGKMINRYFPQCPRYSEDLDGNVVGMMYPGLAIPNEILAHIAPGEMQLHETYSMTNLSLYLGELSRQRGIVVRMTKIIDMHGFGMKHISSKAMIETTTTALSVAQAHFVEHMSRIIIINAPVVFNAVWALIKPILSERTQKKVIVCGTEYKKTLLKYIAPDQLPVAYGGTCTREPIQLFDHDAGFETFTIPPGDSVEKSVQIDGGALVEWSIRSEGKDIGLSVDFYDGNESNIPIHPPARIPSNSHTVVGSWAASPAQSGTARFRFDNSYSRFTSKTVKVRIDTSASLNTK